jgi:hypothetical protein
MLVGCEFGCKLLIGMDVIAEIPQFMAELLDIQRCSDIADAGIPARWFPD